ncbi:hypothetical protein V6N12_007745 [Hibiscus sabdariffa]|uniref:RNase H type-1 domain-containing protein n=1 Tax=Hibiscus sabdariffa TaxID=183260 RepID=A0ABR2F2N7_9ROSI
MVSNMLPSSGDWDWGRLEHYLPRPVLETLVVVKSPMPQYGPDTRCCELFDLDSVTRESILDRGNRLIAECNQVFSRNKVNIIRPVRDGNLWKGPGQGWVKVRHVPREMNGAADKLAAMGRGYSKEGRLLIAPPDMVVTIVNDEQCRWLEGLHAHSDDPAI